MRAPEQPMAAPPDPDADEWGAWMRAAQAGDRAAYERLLRRVAMVARGLGRRRGLDPAACEDLAQEVLMTVHRVRHTYDPARPFGPWLMAIAQRRLIDSQRRSRRRATHEAYDPEAIETFPADGTKDTLEAEDDVAALRAAIATLPPRQREALRAMKLEELSVAQTAARTGQSPGAVKVNVHRALLALRLRFGVRR